jgi:hypothetical protein
LKIINWIYIYASITIVVLPILVICVSLGLGINIFNSSADILQRHGFFAALVILAGVFFVFALSSCLSLLKKLFDTSNSEVNVSVGRSSSNGPLLFFGIPAAFCAGIASHFAFSGFKSNLGVELKLNRMSSDFSSSEGNVTLGVVFALITAVILGALAFRMVEYTASPAFASDGSPAAGAPASAPASASDSFFSSAAAPVSAGPVTV